MSELLLYGGLAAAVISLAAFILSVVLSRARLSRRPVGVLLTALAVIFLLSAFLSFTGFRQLRELRSAFADIEDSYGEYDKGDSEAALTYALRALPEKRGIFSPPYTPEAKKALTDILGVYKLSDTYKPYAVHKLPSAPIYLGISPDGKTAAAVYASAVLIFNTETSEEKANLPVIDSGPAEAVFMDDNRVAYTGENGVSVYDIENDTILWSGKPATRVAVSQNGVIAAVYKGDGETTVYNAEGGILTTLSFAGKSRLVDPDGDPSGGNDNLFALNKDGSLLAVSFSDGSIDMFDLDNSENSFELTLPLDYTRIEGGFYDKYLALSARNAASSAYAVLDLETYKQTAGYESKEPSIMSVNSTGVYLSTDNLLIKLTPATGERQEIANPDSGIRAFATDGGYTLISSDDGNICLFDSNAVPLDKRPGGSPYDFARLAGGYAVLGSRDSPDLRLLKLDTYDESEIFTYDPAFKHDEARVNADNTRVTLFSRESFRLYDINGDLLNETLIPDSDSVSEQRFGKESGNLAVMYKDALRIYSGADGTLIYEKTDLKSVFYAPYGISVLDKDGELSLVDIDAAAPGYVSEIQGDRAAYCGMDADSAFLGEGEVIGAAETQDGFLFAVSDGTSGSVYDDSRKKLFDIPIEGQSEAFFTPEAVVISPLRGTPAVYSLKTGKFLTLLEPDTRIVSIIQRDDYLISEYIAADGERGGSLLDVDFNPLASLPRLTDTTGDTLIFDCVGSLRQSRIYPIEELIAMAKAEYVLYTNSKQAYPYPAGLFYKNRVSRRC
ncbi:MAG: hypothetical protein LBS84_11260 [Clostridiales bacterium]|jgi:WD40 repeat protein|nr:hypothetical protein [Clostridiales bacterium]